MAKLVTNFILPALVAADSMVTYNGRGRVPDPVEKPVGGHLKPSRRSFTHPHLAGKVFINLAQEDTDEDVLLGADSGDEGDEDYEDEGEEANSDEDNGDGLLGEDSGEDSDDFDEGEDELLGEDSDEDSEDLDEADFADEALDLANRDSTKKSTLSLFSTSQLNTSKTSWGSMTPLAMALIAGGLYATQKKQQKDDDFEKVFD